MLISMHPPTPSPQFGKNALIIAAEYGHLESMKLLVEAGAMVDAETKVRGTKERSGGILTPGLGPM